MSKNSSATRQASGPPPKVVPCMPGPMVAAAFSFDMITPSGRPQASGLAATTTSGRTAGSASWIGEVRAGAADAALNLVEDQQRVVLVRQFARLAANSSESG